MAHDYVNLVTVASTADEGAGSRPNLNVYAFHRISGSADPSKASINTAFQSAIQAKVLLALHEDYTQTANMIRFWDDYNDPYQTFTQSHQGAVTGERLPDYVAVTLQLKSAIRGRWGRGSKHYSPIAEADTDGDVLTSGSIALFEDIRDALVAGFTDGDGNVWKSFIISLSGPNGSIIPLPPLPVTIKGNDVVSSIVNTRTAWMRRRKARLVS